MSLDISAYERDVTEHLLFGMARARMFEDLANDPSWNVDLPKAALIIGGRSFQAQILGTYSPGSKTFLWSWANPGSKSWGPAVVAAQQIHARGQHPGYAVFTEREIASGWVHPRELTYVVGELTGGYPIYAPRTNGTAVYLLVQAQLDPMTISPAYLPGILLDFNSFGMGDREACVARFFDRLGFKVSRTATETAAVRKDGTIVRVSWDREQNITNVTLDAMPTLSATT